MEKEIFQQLSVQKENFGTKMDSDIEKEISQQLYLQVVQKNGGLMAYVKEP